MCCAAISGFINGAATAAPLIFLHVEAAAVRRIYDYYIQEPSTASASPRVNISAESSRT